MQLLISLCEIGNPVYPIVSFIGEKNKTHNKQTHAKPRKPLNCCQEQLFAPDLYDIMLPTTCFFKSSVPLWAGASFPCAVKEEVKQRGKGMISVRSGREAALLEQKHSCLHPLGVSPGGQDGLFSLPPGEGGWGPPQSWGLRTGVSGLEGVPDPWGWEGSHGRPGNASSSCCGMSQGTMRKSPSNEGDHGLLRTTYSGASSLVVAAVCLTSPLFPFK